VRPFAACPMVNGSVEEIYEIVEKGRLPVEGCVVERGDEGGIE